MHETQLPAPDTSDYPPTLTKYSAPTKWDKAPYATIWKISHEDGDDIRIQISRDIDNPVWVALPEVLVKAFHRFYSDPSFVDECISMYEDSLAGKESGVDYIEFVKKY